MFINPENLIKENLPQKDNKILDSFERSEKVIYETDSFFDYKIKIVENKIGKFLKFGDSYQAGKIETSIYTGNIPYVNYFFLAPIFKQDIKKVLILGLGAGYFVNILEKAVPEIEKIDIAEIEPELVNIAEKYFGFNQSARINIEIQDARVFLRESGCKYDLIILDIYSEDGISGRFLTQEFFGEIKNNLEKDGLIVINSFGKKELNSKENIFFKSILKTLKTCFANTVIFPTNKANEVLYNKLIGIKNSINDLTNIIIFASNRKPGDDKNRLKLLEKETNFKLSEYFGDKYTGPIDFQNVKILNDSSEYF